MASNSDLVRLWEQPDVSELFMIAGWQQWADAGCISSGLPKHVIEVTGARKIGELNVGGCYMFQVPGTHHFLRPEVKLNDGYREALTRHANDLYYAELQGKGLIIFMGDEPHLDAERYAEAFFAAVKRLGVKRVVSLGGVYGPVPFDKARDVHAAYSLPQLRDRLEKYALKFSSYEGGVTIGTYLLDRAEREGIEAVSLYGFVPAYDFSTQHTEVDGIRVEDDYKAWAEIMHRINTMFGIWIDLTDLEHRSEELTADMRAQIDKLDRKMPGLKVREQLARASEDFEELPFMPLDDMWEDELGDILDGIDQ
ncbi:MAG: PAC2 family protein [Nitrososphaerales archaeon]